MDKIVNASESLGETDFKPASGQIAEHDKKYARSNSIFNIDLSILAISNVIVSLGI
jgi:hypothetical protein